MTSHLDAIGSCIRIGLTGPKLHIWPVERTKKESQISSNRNLINESEFVKPVLDPLSDYSLGL